MKNKFFKKYKINQLQKIKQTYKYIYIFRYNDLIINEIILIKKKLKEFNYKSLILKQKLANQIFLKGKGQGPTLIIYGNNNINLFKYIMHFKKLELLYLKDKKNIYSNLKIKKIFLNNNTSLNFSIIKPIFTFLYYLRKIQKADIT